MDERVIKFLKRHRISALTTLLKDDSPYSAVLHYVFDEESSSFVFLTSIDSKKMENLVNNDTHKASMVIGFSEEEWITMQLQGEIKWISDKQEAEKIWPLYSGKFPGAEKHKRDSNSALLTFKPTWWRYTEVKPTPEVIITSEGVNK